MKFKISKDSIFMILLRSPWWASAGVAAVIATIGWGVLPPKYAPYGLLSSLPFWVISLVAGMRQMRTPSEARVTRTMQAVRALSWRDFSAAIEQALRRDGFIVTRLDGDAADFLITSAARKGVVGSKRWKAASIGIEPLRELCRAMEEHDAQECIYVATGTFTQNAMQFAVDKKIRLLHGATLVKFLREMKLDMPAADRKK